MKKLLLALLLLPTLALAQESPYVYGTRGTPLPSNTRTGQLGLAWVNQYGDQSVLPGNATEASYTLGTLAFGSVSTSYATLVTNSNAAKALDCYNGLNTAVYLSFNASTDHIYIPTVIGKIIDLSSLGLKESSNISVKSIGGAPGSGSIYCTVIY